MVVRALIAAIIIARLALNDRGRQPGVALFAHRMCRSSPADAERIP
jgi:hypothetical protein